jgi:hypothetical protein
MSLLSQTVDNLLGGVSQLPDEQRQPNQVSAMTNVHLTPLFGARKRPPAEDLGLLSSSQTGYSTAFIHSVNRSSTQRYTVAVVGGDLKVFDSLTGASQTVFFPNGKAYLTGTDFRAFTVGDHTFIVNKGVTVKQAGVYATSWVAEALIFIRQVDFSATYQVYLDEENVQYVVPGETAAAGIRINTDYVAQQLYKLLTAGGIGNKITAKFDFTLMGSTIHVKRKDGSEFTGKCYDSLADKGMRFIKASVQAIEDLPAQARDGMVIRIEGDPGSTKDNYWVIHQKSSAGVGDGIWVETTEPSANLALDNTTMPWELVRQGYLTTLTAHQDIPRQPTYRPLPGTQGVNGWTKNILDVTLSGTEADPRVLVGSGGLRSPALNNTSATVTKRCVVSYGLDNTAGNTGTQVTVTLNFFNGTSWSLAGTKNYNTPHNFQNEQFIIDQVCPAGSRFELLLSVSSLLPSGFANPVSRNARLTTYGNTAPTGQTPGITLTDNSAAMLSIGYVTDMWPKGAVINFTLDGVAFSYTLTNDMTAGAVHSALQALIDPHASFIATYTPQPTGFVVNPALDEVKVTRTVAGDAPVVSVATATFPSTTTFWSTDLAMTPSAHVGRILKNLSDGSQGTITANSGMTITVSSLTGGVHNTFKTGDQCAVVDSGSSYYVFRPGDWNTRTVGNDELNPFPSFVGRTINDVFFHGGRLGFLTEDFVCMSAAADIYRFFRKTVTAVLDDDPIDVQSAHKDVAFLDSAVNWQGQLFLNSSAGHQFLLTGEPSVTPATVRLDHLTSYPASAKVRPVAMGNSVYFPRKAGGFTQMRELFRNRDGVQGRLVTNHVQTYIPGDVLSFCGDMDLGFIAVKPDGGSGNEIYIYNFGQLGPDQEHQAWHKWTFSNTVLSVDLFEGYLYVVLFVGTGVRLQRINVSATPITLSQLDGGSTNYVASITLSRPYFRDRQGRAMSGKTTVRTLQVSYHDTNYLAVNVTHANRDQARQYLVNSVSTPVTGYKRVPVLGNNFEPTITLTNNASVGFAISSLKYEYTYTDRSQAQ